MPRLSVAKMRTCRKSQEGMSKKKKKKTKLKPKWEMSLHENRKRSPASRRSFTCSERHGRFGRREGFIRAVELWTSAHCKSSWAARQRSIAAGLGQNHWVRTVGLQAGGPIRPITETNAGRMALAILETKRNVPPRGDASFFSALCSVSALGAGARPIARPDRGVGRGLLGRSCS